MINDEVIKLWSSQKYHDQVYDKINKLKDVDGLSPEEEAAIQLGWDDLSEEGQKQYDKDATEIKKDPAVKDQAKGFTGKELMQKDNDDQLFDYTINQIANELGIDYNEVYTSLYEHELKKLRENIKIPKKLYRGKYNDEDAHLKDDFSLGVPNTHGEGYSTFVSSEPLVAAAYGKKDPTNKFAITTYNPETLSDYIYEVDTSELDPTKFDVDPSATLVELLFGPQYIYKDTIKQGKVKGPMGSLKNIIERIRVSDARMKNIKLSSNIASSIKRRF